MSELEFLAYWEVLCERHRLSPSGPLTRLYALTIRAEGLTVTEWGAAVAASLRFDEFMPPIQKLIDYTRPSLKAQALAEWDTCMERVRRGEMVTDPGTLTRTVMNTVTNGRPLGQVDEDRLPWLKKEFVERYTAHLTTQAQERTPALNAPRREVMALAGD